MKSVPCLTGVRGVAALGVVIYHVYYLSGTFGYPMPSHLWFVDSGWIGVDLFFVLSGFILMYVHAKDFTSVGRANVENFFKLRFWRIYPLHWVVLLLIIVMVGLAPSFRSWYGAQGEGNLTALALMKTFVLGNRWLPLHGEWNQPAWSVSVEILGYAVFPWVACIVVRQSRTLCILAALAILVAYGGLQLAFHKVNYNDVHAWALVRMAAGFPLGMILFKLWQTAPEREKRYHALASIVAVLIVAIACLAPRLMIMTEMAFALLVYSLASQRGIIVRILASRPVMFLGDISFPLYLLHNMPLMCLVYHLHDANVGLPAMLGCIAVYLAILIPACYALHVFVEKPTHRYARRRAPALRHAA